MAVRIKCLIQSTVVFISPAKFYEGKDEKLVFQEQRQWEIASDDVGVEWYQNTTGSPFNGYSWQYREKITINSSEVNGGADLSNFVEYIKDTSDASLGAHDASGTDILFTDSTGRNLLPFEIENYSTTGSPAVATLYAWVKLTTLSHTTGAIIYMYYGNPAGTSEQNTTHTAAGVWGAYSGVWHLSANGSSCGSTIGTTMN